LHSHLHSSGATLCSMVREARYAYASTRLCGIKQTRQIEIGTDRMPGIPPTGFVMWSRWCRMGSSRMKCSGGTNLYKVWLHDRNLSFNRVGGKGVVAYLCNSHRCSTTGIRHYNTEVACYTVQVAPERKIMDDLIEWS
jgi:hypothetical protein